MLSAHIGLCFKCRANYLDIGTWHKLAASQDEAAYPPRTPERRDTAASMCDSMTVQRLENAARILESTEQRQGAGTIERVISQNSRRGDAYHLAEVNEFLQALDCDATEPDSRRWSNLPTLIDLTRVDAERIPPELIAPAWTTPEIVQHFDERFFIESRMVLAVYECGYYCFYKVPCPYHLRGNQSPITTSSAVDHPTRVVGRYCRVPFRCGHEICPECNGSRLDQASSIADTHDSQM